VNAFSVFWPVQNANWRFLERNYSIGCLALVNHFQSYGRHKFDIYEIEKAMLQESAGTRELIFCLLASANSDFVEIDKAMVQRVKYSANSYSAS
jgi:hypothetical protein